MRTVVVGLVLVVAAIGVAIAVTAASREAPVGGAAPQGGDPTDLAGAPTGSAPMGLTDVVAELPDATLEGWAGAEDVPVADLLGGPPLLVNFWATWCAPCVAEMPDLQAVHEAAGDDLRMVGVNTRDAAVNAEPFAEDLGITYDLLVDRDGAYFTDTGGFGMPTTLFVRPDGAVAYRHTGPLSREQLVDLLAEHLDVVVDPAD
jgi:cytochrome c biogenesis protein CcmG, thiol:disulfide interchange protein DsbE